MSWGTRRAGRENSGTTDVAPDGLRRREAMRLLGGVGALRLSCFTPSGLRRDELLTPGSVCPGSDSKRPPLSTLVLMERRKTRSETSLVKRRVCLVRQTLLDASALSRYGRMNPLFKGITESNKNITIAIVLDENIAADQLLVESDDQSPQDANYIFYEATEHQPNGTLFNVKIAVFNKIKRKFY